MKLLRGLSQLQHEHGWLSDDLLRAFAREQNVPLHRVEELVSFYPHFRRSPPPRVTVRVCRDLSCWMAGGAQQCAALRAEYAGQADVEIVEVSCLGRCDAAPAVTLNDAAVAPVTLRETERVRELIAAAQRDESHSSSDAQATSLSAAVADAERWKCDPYADAASRYGTVRQLIAEKTDIAATCVSRLKDAKLRGMGGAGFPTGVKWELVAKEKSSPKYVICNADESEPGTFKDREILHHLPHLVIEGMLLAGLTVGAEAGIIYLRHEYAREQAYLEAALSRARAAGVLGENAAGSGRRFEIEVFVSPGGYILGEETALLEALEDKRGEPRTKPPYPGQVGLWGQPTLINNVETFAFATSIIHHGAEWWRQQGTGTSAGLKFISVSGDVRQPGVYELPLGTTLRALLELAGGVSEDRPLAAILPGGASSNFLPPDTLDVPLDFDAMKQAGSMLGSGAVVFIAEGTDLFALATNIVTFFRNESCGKCVPCRVGSQKSVELLESVQVGETSAGQLAILPELGETLTQTSICGLGQVALNPMLSLLQRFPEAIPQGE